MVYLLDKLWKELRGIYTVIRKEFLTMKWYEQSVFILFLLRPFYLLVPAVTIPYYLEINKDYTYQNAYYYFIATLIEFNLCLYVYKRISGYIPLLFCLIGVGAIIDQINGAALYWNIRTVIWILVALVWVYIVYRRKKN